MNKFELLLKERTQELEKELEERKKAESETILYKNRLESIATILQYNSKNIQDFVDYSLSEIIRLTESAFGYIYFYNEDKKEFTLNSWSKEVMKECAVVSPQTKYMLEKTGLWGEAVRQKKPILINDYQAENPDKKGCPHGHVTLKRFLTIPVFFDGKIVAVVGVANKVAPYNETDIMQLTLLMDVVWKNVSRRQAQEEFDEKNSMLELAMQAANMASWEMDLSTGAVAFEKRKAEMLGYSPDKFHHYTDFTALLHPDDFDPAMNAMKSHLEGTAPTYEIEYRILTSSNEYKWFYDIGSIIKKDSLGKPISVAGLVFDITARKNALESLRESEYKYSTLFNTMHEGFALHEIILDNNGTPVDYRFLDMNPAFEQLTTLKKEDVIGKTVLTVLPATETEWIQKYGRVALSGESISFEMYSGELHKYYQVVAFCPKKYQFAVVFSDITSKKIAENALLESESRFRAIAEYSHNAICIVNDEAKINWVNTRMSEISGFTKAQILASESFLQFIAPESAEFVIGNFMRFVEGTDYQHFYTFTFIRADGQKRITEKHMMDYTDSFGKKHLIISMLDVTDLRTIEARLRQSEKMEAIGQLAGGIAHDFNNVLGGIIGYTDMSLNLASKGSVLESNLKHVLKASDRAKRLVQQILTFSRKETPHSVPIALRPVLSLPLSVNLEVVLSKETDPVVADSTKIHEMLLNLCTNAVYAMNRKGTLRINLYPLTVFMPLQSRTGTITPGDYTVIEIVDTGCGMDTETLNKAFNPFFTTKPVGEGTGMGLSVVLGVIQSHNGDLIVESVCNKGTTFKIFFPISQDIEERSAPEQKETCKGGNERILFVDDEPVLVDMAVDLLSDLGYCVTGIQSSTKALAFLTQSKELVDLLITDLTMPEMSGLELIHEVRKTNSLLPIILCTGFASDLTPQSAKKLSISHMATKPLNRKEFATIVRTVLDTKAIPKTQS